MSNRKCDYPGCSRQANSATGDSGCNHKVCDIHGNGGVETDLDHVVEICWGCDGKGWGDTFPPPLKEHSLKLPSTGYVSSSLITWKKMES